MELPVYPDKYTIIQWGLYYWEEVLTRQKHKAIFWGDGNVLYLVLCGDYMGVLVTKTLGCTRKPPSLWGFDMSASGNQYSISDVFLLQRPFKL